MQNTRFSTWREERSQFTVHSSQFLFKRHPIQLEGLVQSILRNQGLETPLLQRRLVGSWNEVIREHFDADIADFIIESTESKDIRNQTLWVKISSPAVRSDLQMKASDLVAALNNKVGSQIITAIRCY